MASGVSSSGRDHAREREPVEAGPAPAGLRAEQDVRRPHRAGEQREEDAGQVDARRRPRARAPRRRARRAADPEQVARPPRADHGQGQRADELERHRDAERDPGEGLVDRPVHDPEADAEGEHDQPVRPGAAAQHRPGDGHQDDGAGDAAAATRSWSARSRRRGSWRCRRRTAPTGCRSGPARPVRPGGAMSLYRSPGQSRRAECSVGPRRRHGRPDAVDGRDPQGPVDRYVGRGARGLGVHRTALRHGGGLLLPGRHPRRRPAAARRRLVELARPAGLALRRPRRDLAGDAQRRDPLPRGHRRDRRAGLAAGARASSPSVVYAGTEPGRGLAGPTDRGETFALEQALWDHPHRHRVGRRLRRPGLPHDAAAPRPTRSR